MIAQRLLQVRAIPSNPENISWPIQISVSASRMTTSAPRPERLTFLYPHTATTRHQQCLPQVRLISLDSANIYWLIYLSHQTSSPASMQAMVSTPLLSSNYHLLIYIFLLLKNQSCAPWTSTYDVQVTYRAIQQLMHIVHLVRRARPGGG